MSDTKKTLEAELRGILEIEGSLTDEQCARVDSIENEIETIETEARTAAARETAEKRLKKTSFGIGDARTVKQEDINEQYARWALTGQESRGLGDQLITPDTAGGYAVPLDLQNELVKKMNGVAGIRQAVDVRNYAFDVQIAQVADRPTIVDFTGEGAAYDAVGVTFGQVRSYAFKSAAESYVSEELAQDARPAVVQEILEAHAEAHSLFFDGQYAVNGAGGANGPEIIFNSTQTGLNVTESAAVDTLVLADLISAYYDGLPAQYRGGSFSWVMHPTVESVLRKELDGNDRLALQPQAVSTYANMPSSNNILGIPVIISTQAPTYADAQASAAVPACMLMDRSSYRIFDRLPMTTQRDEFSKGSEGKVVFRSKFRSDGRWLAPYRSVAIKLKQA